MHTETYNLLIESFSQFLLEDPSVGATASVVDTLQGNNPSFVRAAGKQFINKIMSLRPYFEKRGVASQFDQDASSITSDDFLDRVNSGRSSALKMLTDIHDHFRQNLDRVNKGEPYSLRRQIRPITPEITVAGRDSIRRNLQRAQALASKQKR